MSPGQLVHAGLVDAVRAALADARLDPGRLIVEVTETALADCAAEVVAALDALRALGMGIALDDFGTGAFSLTHLRRFTIDMVEIDKSLVDQIQDSRSARITGAVIAMAGVLGLAVVAEGVEDVDQASALRAVGCASMQGYLFGLPTGDDALRAVLRPVPGRRPSIGRQKRMLAG